MKTPKFINQTRDQLKEQLLNLRRDQLNLRIQKTTGTLGQWHLFSKIQKDIARIKTILGSNHD